MSSPSSDVMDAPILNQLLVRRYGRVVHYDSRPKEQYGFIEELGTWGQDEVIKDNRIYFHAKRIRRIGNIGNQTLVPRPLVKFCEGDIVEYVVEINTNNEKTSYRAYDITGLHEGYLPFHKGIITFTPYHVALKKMARQDVEKGQAHFEFVHTTCVNKEKTC